MEDMVWVIANWKSNKTIAEALDWISQAGPQIPKDPSTSSGQALKVVVCPAFDALSEVKKAILVGNFPISVGAQDLSHFGSGAYTGEEPAQTLNQLIDLVILGHSERRLNFNETDEIITQKTKQALENNITPLVCVQNESTPIPKECKLVAYEPVFAIGTGNPDTPENASTTAESLKQKHGQDLQVLYGGSVNTENVKSFITQKNLSGVLVGNASLDAEEFIKICKNCAR